MKITHSDDGSVAQYSFRQSWFGNWLMCNHKGQLDALVDYSPPSYETAVGTAMHAGIEAHLSGQDDDTIGAAIAQAYMDEADKPGYRNDKGATPSDAVRLAHRCYQVAAREFFPKIQNIETIEHHFKLQVDERVMADGQRQQLWISGTWDLDEGEGGPTWDWKTSSGQYIPWQVQRWYHQPTFYTLAKAIMLSEIYGPQMLDMSYTFNYGIVIKRTRDEPIDQFIQVTRGREDWAWLITQLWDAVDQRSMQNAPRSDQGWWCSPKWCDHWDGCKGSTRPLPEMIYQNQQPLLEIVQ